MQPESMILLNNQTFHINPATKNEGSSQPSSLATGKIPHLFFLEEERRKFQKVDISAIISLGQNKLKSQKNGEYLQRSWVEFDIQP